MKPIVFCISWRNVLQDISELSCQLILSKPLFPACENMNIPTDVFMECNVVSTLACICSRSSCFIQRWTDSSDAKPSVGNRWPVQLRSRHTKLFLLLFPCIAAADIFFLQNWLGSLKFEVEHCYRASADGATSKSPWVLKELFSYTKNS